MTTFQIIKRFLFPTLKTPIVFIRGVFISMTWGLDSVIHVLFLERIVYFIELGDKEGFQSVLLYYVFYFLIFNIVFFIFRKYGWTEIKAQLMINAQQDYIKDFVELDNNKTETVGVGKMIAIIRSGLDVWGTLMHNLIEIGSFVLMAVLFTLFMLSRVDPVYALIFLSLYILFHWIGYYLNRKVIEIRNNRIESKNMHIKQLVKVLMSKFEILQSKKIEKEIEILDKRKYKSIYFNKMMSLPLALFFRIPEAGMTLVLIGAFFYFGTQVLEGSLALSTLVGLSGALILMQGTITRSVMFYKDITRDFAEVKVMWDFFDNTKRIEGYNTGKTFKYKKGDIQIQALGYAYREGKDIFKDFSLDIKGEKVLALVGNSGGGKSTLAKLISGYIQPGSGDIIIDGQKMRDISLKSYYKSIGYLTQEPSVFDGTVFDNLTYAIERKVSKKELDEIISLSKCEFIYELQDGINTEIGERGVKLSGGQKQRLAIAKIFLKNPKIIILDEPTSALDSFSEEQITGAMRNLFKGRTVIVIAHRLQTVKHADRIVVIEGGQVIEDGNHDSLVKIGGTYAKMLELQSGF